MKTFSMKNVIKIVEETGMKIVSVTRPCEDADGEIALENGYHIQVGDGYFCVNQVLPNDIFMMGPEITTSMELKRELAKIAA